jgi:hypothetical protein
MSTAAFTDEDSVGEVLIPGAQRTSRIQKAAIASVCGAALLTVGFAAGKWQANNQTMRGSDLIGKSASYEQFGEDFSAATAGKSWPEVHRVAQSVLAGQGDLGATYTALQPANKLSFHDSIATSHTRGGYHSPLPRSTRTQ